MHLEETLDRLDTIEQELAALQDEVRHTDALATVGGMAAGLAHELNNLLTPALSYAQLAERTPGDEALVAKALRRTIESIQAATRLLDATLDLATPSHGRTASDCDIGEALTAAIACLSRPPERDGITVEQHLETSTRVRITAPELQQVFVNLLTNATRVLRRRGGGRILVAATLGTGGVEIRFEDDGPGIPSELRTRIFRPFVSSEQPQSGEPQQGGRGLGLAICHRTIVARRGTIALADAPGGGAAFVIHLPAADPYGAIDRAAAA